MWDLVLLLCLSTCSLSVALSTVLAATLQINSGVGAVFGHSAAVVVVNKSGHSLLSLSVGYSRSQAISAKEAVFATTRNKIILPHPIGSWAI
jgi:hypothetical protein